MIYKLSVPAGPEDVEEFRVLEWLGDVGAAFEPGDLIVELETHKAVIEVRAGQAGVLRRALVSAGAWCKIGQALGLFTTGPNDALPEDAAGAGDLLVEFEMT